MFVHKKTVGGLPNCTVLGWVEGSISIRLHYSGRLWEEGRLSFVLLALKGQRSVLLAISLYIGLSLIHFLTVLLRLLKP